MLRKRWIAALFLILSFVPWVQAAESQSPGPGFLVIVNLHNPVSRLDRKSLADMFFKRVTRWPEDGVVQPVDLKADAPARRYFSEVVLGRSVMGVKSYWQQLIFSGQDVPPPELKDDDGVIQFVVKNPGSIGYVSSSSVPADPNAAGIKAVVVR